MSFLVIDARPLFCQLGLRSIWEKYYEEAHAVVFVIDAACPSRFEDSKSALGIYLSYFNTFVVIDVKL